MTAVADDINWQMDMSYKGELYILPFTSIKCNSLLGIPLFGKMCITIHLHLDVLPRPIPIGGTIITEPINLNIRIDSQFH